jgi:hypothetical protein
MGARASFRIQIRLGIRYAENGSFYDGTVKDMSENGMFVISERTDYPDNTTITIKLPVKNESMQLSGKMVRMFRSGMNNSGFGVMLDDPPQEYIDYIEELLLTL